jgi:hypothetical protein
MAATRGLMALIAVAIGRPPITRHDPLLRFVERANEAKRELHYRTSDPAPTLH